MAIGQVTLRGSTAMPYIQPVAQSVFSGGAGIGAALRGLASRMQADEEKLRLEDQRNREQSEDFAARARWTEEQGEWSRSQVDFLNNAPIDGTGITDQRYEELRQRRDQFISTLPPRLQEEYRAITEGTLQDFATNTYTQEYKLRFDYQTNELTKSAGNLASEIRAGRSNLAAAQAEFEELLSTSALPEATKAEMRDAVKVELAGAQFAQIAESALRNPRQVRDPAAGDVVLGGLNPGQRGFLNAIAKRESGGAYDIRYTPSGGAKFSGFADHPRIFEPTKDGNRSSAAGRYQITASTWDDLVNRYGRSVLPDFSPASQDKAALLLARERYHMQKAPGDRSFDELLANGSDQELLRLKAILGGVGNRTTWHAFQTMDDAEFLAIFRGQEGVAGGGTGSAEFPDVWTDPQFAGLDYETKLRLSEEADRAVSSMRATALAAQQEFADALRAQVAAGAAGAEEVEAAIAAGQVPLKEVDALLGLVKEEREARQAAATFAQSVTAGTPLDNTPENQRAALSFLKSSGIYSGLQEQDANAAQQISALFASSGVMPRDVLGLIEAQARSNDPRRISYAMDTLSLMRARAPDQFAAAVSKEMAELEGVWSMARRYSPNGDTNAALEMIKNFRDPAQAAARETMRKEARKQLEEITDKNIEQAFDPGMFTRGPSLPLSPQARGLLRSDFNKLYETYYPMFGDRDATTEFVVDQMRHNWGVDNSSGTDRLMYLAPSSGASGYRPLDGSYDWIREDILSTMGWDENVEFELLSDGQTETEIRQFSQTGLPGSYLIVRRDDDGLMRMEVDDTGLPKRFRFTQTPEVVESQRTEVLIRNLEARRDAMQEEVGATQDFSGLATTVPQSSELDAINAQLQELYSQRRRERVSNVISAPENQPMLQFQEDMGMGN